MNHKDKPDWVILSVTITIISLFIGMSLGDYFSYLSTKQKNETIRAAISRDWSVDQIQGLLNSKN